jgi:hypothetical protein
MLFGLLTLCLGTAGWSQDTMTAEFFEGEVQIVDFDNQTTRFRVTENGTLVAVANSLHIRLVEDPWRLPSTFRILAPMSAVDVIKGSIPATHIRSYPLEHYISLRDQYNERALSKRKSSAPPEKIISKRDTEGIFSLNRSEWYAHATAMVHPAGWKVALKELDTGTSVMAYDPDSGFGLSIQPLYLDKHGPPQMLIVGSYYPSGTFPEFTEQLRSDIEQAVQADLGKKYSVSVNLEKIAPFGAEVELVELTITRATD